MQTRNTLQCVCTGPWAEAKFWFNPEMKRFRVAKSVDEEWDIVEAAVPFPLNNVQNGLTILMQTAN